MVFSYVRRFICCPCWACVALCGRLWLEVVWVGLSCKRVLSWCCLVTSFGVGGAVCGFVLQDALEGITGRYKAFCAALLSFLAPSPSGAVFVELLGVQKFAAGGIMWSYSFLSQPPPLSLTQKNL